VQSPAELKVYCQIYITKGLRTYFGTPKSKRKCISFCRVPESVWDSCVWFWLSCGIPVNGLGFLVYVPGNRACRSRCRCWCTCWCWCRCCVTLPCVLVSWSVVLPIWFLCVTYRIHVQLLYDSCMIPVPCAVRLLCRVAVRLLCYAAVTMPVIMYDMARYVRNMIHCLYDSYMIPVWFLCDSCRRHAWFTYDSCAACWCDAAIDCVRGRIPVGFLCRLRTNTDTIHGAERRAERV